METLIKEARDIVSALLLCEVRVSKCLPVCPHLGRHEEHCGQTVMREAARIIQALICNNERKDRLIAEWEKYAGFLAAHGSFDQSKEDGTEEPTIDTTWRPGDPIAVVDMGAGDAETPGEGSRHDRKTV